jgi:hypothetical protein
VNIRLVSKPDVPGHHFKFSPIPHPDPFRVDHPITRILCNDSLHFGVRARNGK